LSPHDSTTARIVSRIVRTSAGHWLWGRW
jgi:hypothetical protein